MEPRTVIIKRDVELSTKIWKSYYDFDWFRRKRRGVFLNLVLLLISGAITIFFPKLTQSIIWISTNIILVLLILVPLNIYRRNKRNIRRRFELFRASNSEVNISDEGVFYKYTITRNNLEGKNSSVNKVEINYTWDKFAYYEFNGTTLYLYVKNNSSIPFDLISEESANVEDYNVICQYVTKYVENRN